MKNIFNFKSNLNIMYIEKFVGGLMFAYVIENLFAIERGLNIKQMISLSIISSILVLLLEIPTGIISDKVKKRKSILIFAKLIRLSMYVIYIYAVGYEVFLITYILDSIYRTSNSGTEEAFIYESLAEENRESDFEKIYGRLVAIDFIAYGIASIAGAIIAKYVDNTHVYIATIIPLVISVCLALLYHEPKTNIRLKEEQKDYNNTTIRDVFKFIKANYIYIFIYTAITATISSYLWDYYQLYLIHIKIDVLYWGVITALLAAVTSVAKLVAYKVSEKYETMKLLQILLVLATMTLIGAGIIQNVVGIFCMGGTLVSIGLSKIIVLNYIQQKVPDNNVRATVISIKSFIEQIAYIIMGIRFAQISDNVGVDKGLLFFGYCLIALIIYTVVRKFVVRKEKNIFIEN